MAPLLDLPIVTERLLLRAHVMDDLSDLAQFHGDPEVVRYIPWPVRDRQATEVALRTKLAQARLAEGEWLVLAVELRETSTVIGEVLLKWTSPADRQGEVGYAFSRSHQGHGYAAEAVRAMLRLAFDTLELHRVSAVVVEGNDASCRLLQRLGFTRQARLVDNVRHKGEWATQLVYGLLSDEWRTGDTDPDLDELDALVHTFFAAFTSGSGVDGRLDALRAVLLPQAVVVRTCGSSPAVYDVESFIAPRRDVLTNGSLTDFSEHAVAGRFDVFGDIAHWFGRYEKDGLLNGSPCPGAGMKSMQFVRTDAGWRISAAAWDDERPGVGPDSHRDVALVV
ncbi:GNAT family N-acetyltransferase [Jatrophihabitans fulvus]